MNCVVFGGTGFIGTHLCRKLADQGNNVRAVGFGHNPYVETIEMDFSSAEAFDGILKDVDVVFHLVSSTVPGTCMESCYYDLSANVLPTVKLLDSCVRANVKKVVFLSSGGTVYGIPQKVPITEEHGTFPINPYGIHKLAIEKCLHYYYCFHGLDYCVLRLSNPYGEGQNFKGNQGVISIFLYNAVMEEPVNIIGKGNTVRDYIYIDDAVDGIISAARYNGEYKIFNIGSGKGTSLMEIISAIEKLLNRKIEIKFLSDRKIDVLQNVLDITRAKEILGWAPRLNLDNGLKKTMEYIKSCLQTI